MSASAAGGSIPPSGSTKFVPGIAAASMALRASADAPPAAAAATCAGAGSRAAVSSAADRPDGDGGRLAPRRGLRLCRLGLYCPGLGRGGARGRCRVPAAEGARHRPQRRRDLARDDPERVARALRELRQRLQVLVGEQLGVGVVVVHGLEDRARWPAPRLRRVRILACLTPSAVRMALCFSPSAVRILDCPDALGGQDRGALLPLGAHLLLHRVLDRLRRVDGLDLHPGDPDAPLARRVIEHAAQHVVDVVARGQRLLQVHRPDHAAQHRRGDLLDAPGCS